MITSPPSPVTRCGCGTFSEKDRDLYWWNLDSDWMDKYGVLSAALLLVM
jgi:hypothetical protein